MLFTLRSMVVAGLATVLAVVIGVVVLDGGDRDGEAQPAVPPEAESTPLAELDTTSLAIGRVAFCNSIADDAVSEVLGADAERATSYDNGERAQVTRKVEDVAHEFGCAWSADQATARGWVFAPPVTRGQARRLVEAAAAGRGCRPPPDPAQFGNPSVALVCATKSARQASYRGLFGDAWLTCSLTVPESTDSTELVERTERWCVAVMAAAALQRSSPAPDPAAN